MSALAAPELDPVLHAPARLKIMMLLAATSVGAFNALAKEANLTPGNLASHLKALETAGYVESQRTLIELRPRVRYALTPLGRDALRDYCAALEATIREIQQTMTPRDEEP